MRIECESTRRHSSTSDEGEGDTNMPLIGAQPVKIMHCRHAGRRGHCRHGSGQDAHSSGRGVLLWTAGGDIQGQEAGEHVSLEVVLWCPCNHRTDVQCLFFRLTRAPPTPAGRVEWAGAGNPGLLCLRCMNAASNGRAPSAAADRRKFGSHCASRKLFCKKWMWTKQWLFSTSARCNIRQPPLGMTSDIGLEQQRNNQSLQIKQL